MVVDLHACRLANFLDGQDIKQKAQRSQFESSPLQESRDSYVMSIVDGLMACRVRCDEVRGCEISTS